MNKKTIMQKNERGDRKEDSNGSLKISDGG